MSAEIPCIRCGKAFTPTADWQKHCGSVCRHKDEAAALYREALNAFPAAGTGNHGHMQRVANLGVLAGLADSEIEADIKQHAKRKPDPGEAEEAIDTAHASAGKNQENHHGLTPEQHQHLRERRRQEREAQEKHGQQMAVEAVRKLAGEPITLDALMRLSPIIEPGADFTNEGEQRQNAALMLATLYAPQELVFIGGERDTGREFLRSSSDLQAAILDGAEIPPFVIQNPFSGTEGRTKKKKPSFRADECISALRYCLYECDFEELDIGTKAAFIASRIKAGWPIVSVVYSGGKSLHALLKVDITTAEQWQSEIREKIFPVLQNLGADRQCKNPSRLTRLPGGRHKSGNLSALIYLNPDFGHPSTTRGPANKA